ncbi:MAG: sugar kinase [Armatimonadetes bacterium]|nr:sugar kinase [Armatimonadota bacterium]
MEIIAIGELLVEVMRTEVDAPLSEPGLFTGPYPSGAPAIFASQAARLGHKTGMVGAVGKDDFGLCLRRRFAADGIDDRHVVDVEGLATGVAFVAYFGDGSRRFIFHFGNSAAGQLPPVDDIDLSGTRFVHICGCTLSGGGLLRERCYELAERAAAAGVGISFDPNLRPELLGGAEAVRQVCAPVTQRATVISPGTSEAMILADADDPDIACRKLLEGGARLIALKLGSAGCRLYTQEEIVEVAAKPVRAVDPTGAGDCFDAAIVVGMIEGLPLERIGRLANACGALATTKVGPMEGAAFREEVEAFM